MSIANLRTLLLYLVIAAFFGFLSYNLVLWFRHNVGWRSYVVQSGSMEPSIMTGDLIIIKAQDTYQKNEVITFKDTTDRTVTHRIIEVFPGDTTLFTTKGDANQDADTAEVPQENVVGKVVQVIPKFGYVVQFIKSPWGFILCILTPGILIMYDEVTAIVASLKTPARSRRRRID